MVGVLAVLGTLAGASPAAATGLQLTVSQDPVRGVPIHFSVSGMTPGADQYGNSSYYLFAFARPASLGSCGSSDITDPGEGTDDVLAPFSMQLPPGPSSFAYPWTGTSSAVGEYLACAWIDDIQGTGDTVATAQLPFSIRAPHFTLTVHPPAHPTVGQRLSYTVHGTEEISAHVTVWLLPRYVPLGCNAAGTHCGRLYLRKCAPDPSHEIGLLGSGAEPTTLFSRNVKAGRPFTASRRLVAESSGTYEICGWVYDQTDSGPMDLRTSTRVTVLGR